jgi:hypothetical protein
MEKRANAKAQSGMEYLMSYGWVILILVIVAAAFYALGVFNPLTFAGRTVTGFQVLGTPLDWELRSANGNLTLNLVNGRFSTPVTIYKITAAVNGISTSYDTGELTIIPGASDEVTFPISPVLEKGSTYSVRVTVLYNSGGLNHTDIGTVTGVVS